jgi:hypothetical protein
VFDWQEVALLLKKSPTQNAGRKDLTADELPEKVKDKGTAGFVLQVT